MRRRRAAALIAGGIVFGAAPNTARAQVPLADFPSPEAAVAYLFFGIENGTDAKLDGARRWRLTASSPAQLVAGDIRATVRRESACRYTVVLAYPDGPFRGRIDLARIDDWTVGDNEAVFTGDGVCLPGAYGCPAKSYAFHAPRVEAARHRRVYEALRTTCPR